MRLLAALILVSTALNAAELRLGKPLALKQTTAISELNASPERFVGKDVQVKGKVTEVCQMVGCWMAIADPESDKIVRIKVQDGDIVFPKDAAGKTATAEGKFVKIKMTKAQAVAQAKHEAEENGKPFDPASRVSTTVYQIQGYGAVLVD